MVQDFAGSATRDEQSRQGKQGTPRRARFARWVFLVAGVYGLLALAPMYFLKSRFGQDYPPAITHPEFFYGFVGVALAWQVAFLVIAHDPARYRPLMIPAVLEKFSFTVAAGMLFAQGRLPAPLIAGAAVDGLLGVLFLIAFLKTSSHPHGPLP